MNPANDDQHGLTGREAVEATAAVWLSLRDRGMTAAETEAFVRWLQESPEHAAVFEELQQTWRDFDQLATLLRPGAAPDPDTLAPRRRRRFARLPLVSLAAAAGLALLALGIWEWRGPQHFAETPVGAFQKIDLPDGSVAQLNTDSAIDVDMRGNERRVRIVRGEIDFAVRKDRAHPFIVSAGRVEVRAVGTAFNVRARDARVEVLVSEGLVQVCDAVKRQPLLPPAAGTGEPAYLAVGDRAVISAPPPAAAEPVAVQVQRVSGEQLRRALAWQERRLEFDDTPLGEVVAEFNRYNRVKLVVTDAQLAARPFSGTFRTDGYEALVALLQHSFGVTVVRQGDAIQLAPR
ncbi:FecR domain-containing protein [Opitutus sp. ER46]|uniref:FecR family protein n=1 Tax=Opitutus sp. ER46 TaxID=2161864 RepID=UPI000D3115F2|nr:FecR domain-containing protein [Opitutus sp. ER46]PTX91260.1 hypothetical protein DB354_21770 [Opitutus sp. ER46]